jgi:hypothetical protein
MLSHWLALEKHGWHFGEPTVSDLVSIPLQFNFNTGGDLDDATSFNLNIQPVIPFKLTPAWHVIARAIVPVDSVPGSDSTSFSGVGDIQLQLYLTPTKPRAVHLWRRTGVLPFPTPTAPALRTGPSGAGVGFVGLTLKGPWVIGGLINQFLASIRHGRRAEDEPARVAPRGQLQLRRGLGDVVFARDHRELGRVRRQRMDGAAGARHHEDDAFNGRPMNLGLSYFGNVKRPEGSAAYQLRFAISLLHLEKR